MKEHPWSALPGKALLACLFLVACTPAQLPQPDPLKDEVIILQKQLLELQKLQLQTKTKLAEATTTIDALSIKVKALEDRQNRAAAPLKQDIPAVKKETGEQTGRQKEKEDQEAGMTKRSHTLVITFVIATAIVLFPSTAWLQEKTETPASAPTTETAASAPTETAASAPQENNIYIITQGDTLWDISNSALKDPFLWPLIWKENPSITNPDLIYPGNRLTIPSLAPIERAMQAPAEAAPAPEERVEKADTAATPEAAAPAETVKKPPTTAAPVQEEAPAKRELILEQETVHPLIDKYTMLSAGYVSTDQWEESITGTLEPKAMFGFDDIVFIKVSAPENVKIGDKYLVFAPVKKVKHPQTRKKLGRLIKILGILQVIEKAPGATYLTARISLSFDSMAKGNLLAPYQEPMLIYAVPKNDGRNIDGRIIEVMDSRSMNGNFDMLYLDKGSSDGVKPGDRFTVFLDPLKKGYPKKIIGEAMVVLVKDTTATAMVKNSTDPIAKGDKVELVK